MRVDKKIVVLGLAIAASACALAQTAWPKIQSEMYPYSSQLQLVRHEQSILLGEGKKQTGIFFSTAKDEYSEKIHKDLMQDAGLKDWRLHSYYRYGTTYVLTFTQVDRILDIRLANSPRGVDATYSVVLNQDYKAPDVAVAQVQQVRSPETKPWPGVEQAKPVQAGGVEAQAAPVAQPPKASAVIQEVMSPKEGDQQPRKAVN